jgi:uncharacterized integral membrane protein
MFDDAPAESSEATPVVAGPAGSGSLDSAGSDSTNATADVAGTPGPPAASTTSGRRRRGKPVDSTKVSTVWVAVVGTLVVLVVVLVFILENLHSVRATFFGAHWQIPLGVDLLFAAVLGGLVVVMVGALRMLQLRREARRRGNRTEV